MEGGKPVGGPRARATSLGFSHLLCSNRKIMELPELDQLNSPTMDSEDEEEWWYNVLMVAKPVSDHGTLEIPKGQFNLDKYTDDNAKTFFRYANAAIF
jgi:hypothetical protein